MPRVSVLIPCYNAAPFLDAALDSVAAQTFADWEIIAVDDASTDGTGAVLARRATAEPRLTVIRHAANAGVSASRNDALAAARGEFVYFLDGDDLLEPTAVADLLAVQAVQGADLTIGNVMRVAANGERGSALFRHRGRLFYAGPAARARELPEILRYCDAVYGRLFRLAVIRRENIQFAGGLSVGEDTLFTHSFALVAAGIAVDTELSGYLYRQHPASCVHTVTAERLLANLEKLLYALRELAARHHCGEAILYRKAAEYVWSIKRQSADAGERQRLLRQMLASALFREIIAPAINGYGKFRHRLLLRLLRGGNAAWLRWW